MADTSIQDALAALARANDAYKLVLQSDQSSDLPPGAGTDPMWASVAIDPTRWSQAFPYQILIVYRDPRATQDASAYSIFATYTLPIPPMSHNETLPFAINTQVTLGGIIEQHNGVPLRALSFTATTGVLPAMPASSPLGQLNLGQAILAGSVTANLTGNGTAFQQGVGAASTLGLGSALGENTLSFSDTNETGTYAKNTGYYQWLTLRGFMEAYAFLKKSAAGKNYRMAVGIWKTQDVYLATPISVDLDRTAASPMEWPFRLNFHIWKRILLQYGGMSPLSSASAAQVPADALQLLGSVNAVRVGLLGA